MNGTETGGALRIATARIDWRGAADEQVIDITVKSAGAQGRIMAPTWELVRAYQEDAIDWTEYTRRYTELLRARYHASRRCFHALVENAAREKRCLVLTCYCVHATVGARCHRFLMAAILARIARGCGLHVTLEGERAPRSSPVDQLSLWPRQ